MTRLSAAKFDTSVTGSGYPTNNFGLTSSVSGKMSVTGSGSSKMLPNLPPGVASMIPQYMIGAGAGAGELNNPPSPPLPPLIFFQVESFYHFN